MLDFDEHGERSESFQIFEFIKSHNKIKANWFQFFNFWIGVVGLTSFPSLSICVVSLLLLSLIKFDLWCDTQFFSFIHSIPFNLIWNKIQIIVTIWTEQRGRVSEWVRERDRQTLTANTANNNTLFLEWTDVVNDKWNDDIHRWDSTVNQYGTLFLFFFVSFSGDTKEAKES